MKKTLVIAGLAVLSTSAFASKARLQALGQDGRASLFLDDSRSVFLNPAKLNSMSDYVVAEWGTSASTADSEAAPHAEGGFFKKSNSFSYGVYVGNEYDTNNSTKSTANVATTDNVTELFLAGDMGMKWGARFSFSSNENKPSTGIKKENSTMGLGLGVEHGAIEAYTNILLKDESKGGAAAGDKYDAETGINVGASYGMNGMKFYADYDKSGYKTTISNAITAEVTESNIAVGVAKTHEIAAGSTMFMDVRYNMNKEENKKATGTSEKEVNTNTLPLTVGFETAATSWLTLRASVVQNVVIGDKETKLANGSKTEETVANSTRVNAGATFTFGKLMVDGVIGTTDSSRTGTVSATSKKGVLATDNLMTRVAVSYWF
ncbi:hypothetical protein [Bacteriovorax sp. Seq25_V]|uniref:hypothetical protein n=1 Tax=Bacteriovorax sp. Seq25_V TaxID=1201288 RepID=UPI00038A42F4|nr:hypothetical protein [Bacteriovorax sp. Seq25_V]EQC44753.1 hypothetical protein M900_0417 [Bacteriovorax sp. Seq25_V]